MLLKVVTIGFKQDETQTVCVKPLITKVERAWSWDWPLVVDIFFHYIWTLQRKSQEFVLIPFKGLLKTLGAFYIPHAEYFEWFNFFYFVLHSPCDFNKSNPWFPCIAKLDLMLKVSKSNTQIPLKKEKETSTNSALVTWNIVTLVKILAAGKTKLIGRICVRVVQLRVARIKDPTLLGGKYLCCPWVSFRDATRCLRPIITLTWTGFQVSKCTWEIARFSLVKKSCMPIS